MTIMNLTKKDKIEIFEKPSHMITRSLIYILAILCYTNLQGQHYKKPNVVLIIIDDLNDFPEGFYGHPQAKTPHMKALGVSSARFKHAY